LLVDLLQLLPLGHFHVTFSFIITTKPPKSSSNYFYSLPTPPAFIDATLPSIVLVHSFTVVFSTNSSSLSSASFDTLLCGNGRYSAINFRFYCLNESPSSWRFSTFISNN